MFSEEEDNKEAGKSNMMVRMARMGKIYKLLRLMRLVKLFKIFKNKENLSAHFTRKLKISAGAERLSIAFAMFIFAIHIFSCLFMLLGTFTYTYYLDTWINDSGVRDMNTIDSYIYTAYFIVTTMTTVGYGDQSANTMPE